MNRYLAPVLASFSLIACASSAHDDANSETAAISATSATEPPAAPAIPVDGSYKGSCGNKYGSVDLTVTIANGKVASITGDLEGRDGKLRVNQPMTDWTAPFTATAQSVDATIERAIVTTAGSIAYSNETRVMQEDETTIVTTGTCNTSLSFASIEVVPHNAANNVYRSVTLHGVAASGPDCDIANGPVDANGANADWEIDCAEDEGAVTSEGLDVITAVLRGALK